MLLSWGSRGVHRPFDDAVTFTSRVLLEIELAETLEVTGGGTGVVSHAGLGLVRRLADKTGLTGGAVVRPGLGHDRGRVLADISCVIADGARAISDCRVLADQKEAFGQVASVPTEYRTLGEIAEGGTRCGRRGHRLPQ